MKKRTSINRLTPAFAGVLLAVVFSCNNNSIPTNESVVISKHWGTLTGIGILPEGICTFQYENGSGNWVSFQDSCHKYSVGDKVLKNFR